jgi:radical SAM/Cys-rich protein
VNTKKQLEYIEHIQDTIPVSFNKKINQGNSTLLQANGIETLQLNTGKKCNLSCKHCHVDAGPDRTELMQKEIFLEALKIAIESNIDTIDITGGAPEINPNLEWFLNEASNSQKNLIVRSNLVILLEPDYTGYIELYKKNNVTIIASLPDYTGRKANKQRGNGNFNKIINVISKLNKIGYGMTDSNLKLNLVHNPIGAYLPGSQRALSEEYKKNLRENFSVEFNELFCMTNIPIGRYLEYLIESGNYKDYIRELYNAFNPKAIENVMCTKLISVGWDGVLYDCDFNQMLGLPVNREIPGHINKFDYNLLRKRKIVVNNHCYGCVAGSGSSCKGEIAN